MSDIELEIADSLERIFPVPVVVASWDDVLERAAAVPRLRRDLERATGREHVDRRRRRRYLIAIVAAALVVAVVASALATVREFLYPLFLRSDVRTTRVVEGVRFSFIVHQPPQRPYEGQANYEFAWENGPIERIGWIRDARGRRLRPIFRNHGLLIDKSIEGGQAGEAVIFWTAFPEGGEVAPCTNLRSQPIGGSTAALAEAMAQAPGIEIVQGPMSTTVDGHPATHVVLRVRRDLGCDPGYFFKWPDQQWGAFWPGTTTGDMIRVWIVDVAGKRLVIEAETKQPDSGGPTALNIRPTRADVRKVEGEIAQIIESIRFDD
jgi:hypothetical protein